MKTFAEQYLEETDDILATLNRDDIETIASALAALRKRHGRLFILGVGGSAATASHAVNDFRKITGIETYAPTDNVAELTARTNDNGWATTFVEWLDGSQLTKADAVLVLSVGGGSPDFSQNIVRAIEYAVFCGTQILGIVGRDGGATKDASDACLVIPPMFENRITPHTEGLASVILHLLVSHPALTA